MAKTTAFPWYGSKYTQVNWLLDLFPSTERYVEPFGGSGVVLVNKEPTGVETFNDINGEIVNFFDVIRNEPAEFERRLLLTPHSREMYTRAMDKEPKDDITRALYFLIRTAQSFGGITGGGWGRSIGNIRRNMGARTAAWKHRTGEINTVAKRMRRVQIENTDAIELIEDHDHEDCLFYCDPPYPEGSRKKTGQYVYEYTDSQHRELFNTLDDCGAYVVVSGYSCKLLDTLYSDWYCYKEGEKKLAGETSGTREEVVWTNYDVSEVVDK